MKLVQIADAGVKSRTRSWWTLGRTIIQRYTFNEQIEAIRRLGNSGDQRALDYLRRLNETEEQHKIIPPSEWEEPTETWQRIHPNAKGELHYALSEWSYRSSIGTNKHGRGIKLPEEEFAVSYDTGGRYPDENKKSISRFQAKRAVDM